MKRIALLVPLLMCVSHAVFADEQNTVQATANNSTQITNTIRIDTRPEILGLWGMEIPNNKKCTEYYSFRGANEVVVNSAKEWSTGLYDYQPSEDHKERLPALVLQIKYDNNQMDCSGQTLDQTGEVSQYFVKWENDHTINFCANEKGEKCFATLRRVLP